MVTKISSSNFSELKVPVPLDIIATFTIPASAAAGTVVIGQFVPDPTQPTTTESSVQAPPDESYRLDTVYSTIQTPAVDGYVKVFLNNKDMNILFGPLSQTYTNIFGFKVTKARAIAQPNGELQLRYVTAAANTLTSAVTVTVNTSILRVPINYKGPLPD
jgi:hypothetical protein